MVLAIFFGNKIQWDLQSFGMLMHEDVNYGVDHQNEKKEMN